jgi:hypothetical protein
MNRISTTLSIIAMAILAGPAGSLAQGGTNDPSGAGNSSRLSAPPAPGTNSAGTAQSSGAAPNTQSGVTTGSARSAAPGTTDTTGPSQSEDAAIKQENEAIDHKLKGICRGC